MDTKNNLESVTPSGLQKIVDQHEQLRASIEELRVFLELPRPPLGHEGCETWACALAEKLTRLHDKVTRHFREEERSGFLLWLESEYPHAAHAVDSLRKDHDRILDDIRAILSAALLYEEGRHPETIHMRTWAHSVLDQLLCHEQEETELMQRLQYEDLGIGD